MEEEGNVFFSSQFQLSSFHNLFRNRIWISAQSTVMGISTSWYVSSRLYMMLSAICFVCLHNHRFQLPGEGRVGEWQRYRYRH